MAEESNGVAEVNPEVFDSPASAEAGVKTAIPAEASVPTDPNAPPPGYENTPPELWPDADGNPPKLTEALMRKLRGRYFTVKHPTLGCGHKLNMTNQPGNNCETCWYYFFNTHPQLVEVADQFYRTQSKGPMTAMRGKKFVTNFGRYMVTVIGIMQEQKAREEANGVTGQEPGSTAGSSTDSAAVPSEAPAPTEG